MRWIILAVVAVVLAGAAAFAQTMYHGAPMQGTMLMQGTMPMQGNMPTQGTMPMQGGMPVHMRGGRQGALGSLPTQPGQAAFGAVQEVVGMLEADPATDWSKVNLDALRVHLIDMSEVTLHADAAVERIDGGIRVAVTGTGRTLVAIQRMLPEHAREMNGKNGWIETAEPRPDGITLTVTSTDPKQVAIIRGLGFIGVMASGGHHQMRHIMMAKGGM
jgi:hypothetical protein